MREILSSIERTYRNYKTLGEGAIQQLREDELSRPGQGESNSVAVNVWHISGNLKSRFTDFLTSDGEKPWRRRDEEFLQRSVTSAELNRKWEEGWAVLFNTLASLTDEDLIQTVTIRGQKSSVHETLFRLMTHTSYHVGQVVYLAKAIRGSEWKCLSIPLGKSEEYNSGVRAR